ncbi:hypothetical protein BWZ20_00935 [Winogradskyella sp. J14-2]|uniref:DUF547 domain-containing protein n=1 Tax=Winogradskyella sp. J14-2 TaxID=1936080 RepID=UPI000972A73A|nr:DUF547 domain-containing protein [Winogradskyella sp. J14-2]APY06948.1 hypothetical protein BWZ20_00935 [Winogradskyella sp. J14-2]
MNKNILISIIVSVLFITSCISSKGIDFKKKPPANNNKIDTSVLDHSNWDLLLKKYVDDQGFVDYKGFVKDKQKLYAYTDYLSEHSPEDSWSYNEQLAYFINVYNANTIKLVVENYPVKSIKDISATFSPFLKNFIKIDDKTFSLADIEKGFLQKMNEPKIHFAINCASYSCPKLMRDAYTAENVEKLMNTAVQTFINSKKNKITPNKATLSKIFKWYKKDFLNTSESIIDYINQYSDVKIEANAIIDYKEYNWSLNDTK